MRSHNLARALLRCAARNSSSTNTTITSISTRVAPRATGVRAGATASLRGFSSTSVDLKKKAKKDAFAAAEQNDDEFDLDQDDDDLFGGVTSSPATSSSTTSSSSASSSVASRVDFAKALEEYRAALEWEVLDRGQFPSQSRWRQLAGHASNQAELEQVLELAKLYRDRIGSLGVESGKRFASRASRIGLPEVAVNAFMDTYRFGLEYDAESLYFVQRKLARKLESGNRDKILASAELPGAPVQETDLFGMVASDAGGEAEAAAAGQSDGKAEAIGSEHELDMALARAQLTIIDRMALIASLAPKDTLLLSYVTRAYIETFKLTDPASESNPLLKGIYERTKALTTLVTSAAQSALATNAKLEAMPLKRTIHLAENLKATLSYVAVSGRTTFNDPVTAKPLDPVRTLYRFMDKSGPQRSDMLVSHIEPLLQTHSSA